MDVRAMNGVVDDDMSYALRNNMIIPEYVIDIRGNYPTDRAVAQSRLLERREGLEETIRAKYAYENDVTYRLKYTFWLIGFAVVSPILIPIIAINEDLNDAPGLINKSPYEKGWIVQVKLSDLEEQSNLMTAEEYQKYLESIG